MTLVVNLYGGPGTGKSTTAALTFGLLKSRGHNAELVTEVAKDLTWEERHHAIRCQPYVFGKQMFRIERLLGQVDVIVTDSPILLSTVYGRALGSNFRNYVLDVFRSWDTLDVFLRRDHEVHPFNPKGRLQNEEEAKALDGEIRGMLDSFGVSYSEVPVRAAEGTAVSVVGLVETRLADGKGDPGEAEGQETARGAAGRR